MTTSPTPQAGPSADRIGQFIATVPRVRLVAALEAVLELATTWHADLARVDLRDEYYERVDATDDAAYEIEAAITRALTPGKDAS